MAGIDVDFSLTISDTVVVQIIAMTDTTVNFVLVGLKAKWIGKFYLIYFLIGWPM